MLDHDTRSPGALRSAAVLACAAALCQSAGALRAQEAAAPAPQHVAYLEAVRAWRAGDDGVALAWSDWRRDELNSLRGEAAQLVGAATLAETRAAVRLHVIAAQLAASRGAAELWSAHHEMAAALLPHVGPDLGCGDEAGRLRRNVPLARGYAVLRGWQPSLALDAFKHALGVCPQDPEVLLAAGAAEELRALVPALHRDRYVSSPELAASGALNDLLPTADIQRRDAERSRDAAEAYFRRALEAAPGLAEARLRLGRTLAAAGRHEEAQREWSRVVEESGDPDAICLASLYLGRVAEKGGDWPGALGHYRTAVAACPEARSTRFALASALDRAGEREPARQQVLAVLSAPADGRTRAVDPWLRYHFEPRVGLGALLDELARRPR